MANDSILIQVQLGSPTKANVNAVTKQIQSALSNVSANVQIQNGRQAAQTLQTIKKGTDDASRSMTSFGEAIGLSGRRFLAFTSAVAVVGRLTSALSQATREAIKFEREFVKLAQVFDTDVKALGRLQSSISELAQEFGLSATVIAKTSVVLAQSGLTARETEQAMAALAKTTLAATFDSLASSTEGAVAIMAQFGTEASKLESQFGAINAVSKRFAVESGDIIEAVRRAGGAFRAAGGNLNDFIALFTAVRSTTRESAETIATGFRTIFARIQRPKTIEFFRELNIELTDGRGNFIGAFEAIKRLSRGLEEAGIKAGSLQFAGVVEQLGGIRQVSRVIPLLQQFTKAEKARQVTLAGAGSLDADAAKAQATLAQAFARTTENFRALIREISQTETFQAIVRIALDLANAFIEVARSLKPIIPLIATFAGFKLTGVLGGALKKGLGGAGGTGGLGQGFKRGGPVPGTGSGDTVPAMLEPGEFVIRKSAVQAFGADRLSRINKYARGGPVRADRLKSVFLKKRTKSANSAIPEEEFQNGQFLTNSDVFTFNKSEYAVKANKTISSKGFEKKVAGLRSFGGSLAKRPQAPVDIVSSRKGPVEVRNRKRKTSDIELVDKFLRFQYEKNNKFPTKLKTKESINLGKFGVAYNSSKLPAGSLSSIPKRNRFAKGGAVGTDTVPALLTPGEFVINKKSAETFGYGNLKKINKYAKGGPVQKFANGGFVGATTLKTGAGLDSASAKKLSLEFNKRVAQLKALGVSDKKLQTLKREMLKLLALRKRTGSKIVKTEDILAKANQELGKARSKAAKQTVKPTGKPVSGAGGGGGQFDGTSAFFALSALAGQFDLLNTVTKKLKGLFGDVASASQLEAFSSGLVKTVTQFGILAFAAKSLGIALTKEALTSQTRSKTNIAAGAAAVALGAFAVADGLSVLVDSLFDFAGRQKELESTIKSGDVGNAVSEARDLNKDIQAGNQQKVGLGIAGGAAAGALIGSFIPVIGTAVGALIGAVVGGVTGYFNQLDPVVEAEVRARAEGFNALKQSNKLEDQKKNILQDVTRSEGARAEAAAALSLKQIKLNKEATGKFQKAVNSAKRRGAEDEELSKLTDELNAAKEAEKQRTEALSQELLGQITAISSSNIALKTSEDIYKRLTPAQKELITQLGITKEEFDNTANTQLALNAIRIKELTLMQTRLVLEQKLQQSLSRVQIEASNLEDRANRIRGRSTFNAASSAFARGPNDPGFSGAVRQGGRILGQTGLAEDILQIQGALQKAPLALAESINIITNETEDGIRKVKLEKIFNDVFGNIDIKDEDLKKQLDVVGQAFKAALATNDIQAAQEEFKKALDILAKEAKERGEKFNQANKLFEQQLSTFSSLLDERNQKESDFLKNVLDYSKNFFTRADRITGLRGGTVTRTDLQRRSSQNVAGLGFGGKSGLEIAKQLGQLQRGVSGGPKSSTAQINKQKELERTTNKATLALEEYKKGLEAQAGLLEEQIEKEKSLTQARRNFSEQFVFGSDDQRKDLLQNVRNAQIAAQQGNLAGATTQERQGILSILKQFENAAVFNGQTGREVQNRLMANELARLGLIGPEQYNELIEGVSTEEEKLIDNLEGIFQEQNAIEKQVLENEKAAVQSFDQAVNRFGNAVDKFSQGPNGNAEEAQVAGRASGGLIYAAGGTLVNFKPQGTDTVPAMLTPGEFVIKKSSVDKYGTGMMQAINAGNYAGGGSISPKYLQNGGLTPLQKEFQDNAKEQLIFLPDSVIPSDREIRQQKGLLEKIAAKRRKTKGFGPKPEGNNDFGGPSDFTEDFFGEAPDPNDPTSTGFAEKLEVIMKKDAETALNALKDYRSLPFRPKSNLKEFIESSDIGEERQKKILKAFKDRGIRAARISDPTPFGKNEAVWIYNQVRVNEKQLPYPFPKLVADGFPPNPSVLTKALRDFHILSASEKFPSAFGLIEPEYVYKDPTQAVFSKNNYFKDYLKSKGGKDALASRVRDLGFNSGGPVGGAPGIDANPAMLTRGEYVINKQSAQAIGMNNLNRLNSIKGYNNGGPVGYFANGGQPLSSPSRSRLLLNQSIDLESKGFTTSVSEFTRAIEEFNEIPKDFTMTLAPTQVTVSINGAEILAQIMPEIQNEILSQTSFKIEEFRQQLKSGDV